MADFNEWLSRLNLNSAAARHIDDDADGSYDCVDIPEDWCQYLWPSVPINHILGYGNAKDLYANASSQYFEKLPPNITAQAGDIPVWGATPTNAYGHIAVTIHDDGTNLTVVEQNTYTQEAATIAHRSHTNIIGFLRPKENQVSADAVTEHELNVLFQRFNGVPANQNDKNKFIGRPLSDVLDYLTTNPTGVAYTHKISVALDAHTSSVPAELVVQLKELVNKL